MRSALYVSSRLVTSLSLTLAIIGNTFAISLAQAETISFPIAVQKLEAPASVSLKQEPVLLANHTGSIGTNQLLTAGATTVGGPHLKSLWGSMILSMAFQQDAQIQQIAKKLGRLNGFVFTSVGLISGLSLAQSIDGIANVRTDPEPYHPPIIGLIGSSLSVLSIGTQAALSHHYKKQLLARQDELTHEVEHILESLKTDGMSDHITGELNQLIGQEAAEDFIGLWNSAHTPSH